MSALIVKSGLNIIDRWYSRNSTQFRYFVSLAKVVYIWREYSRKVYEVWTQMHGSQSANQHALKMIPKCIAGRWGSIHATQTWIRRAGQKKLPPVLLAVIGAGAGKQAREPREGAPIPLKDEARGPREGAPMAPEKELDPIEEEVRHHRQIMGKYRKDAKIALETWVWWRSVETSERASKPLEHHHAFIRKALVKSDTDLARTGNGGSHMVCGKAREIFHSFEEHLFSDFAWVQQYDDDDTPLENHAFRSELIVLQIELCLHHAASYFRRIVKPAEQFPYLLCWCGESDRFQPCDHRRRCLAF